MEEARDIDSVAESIFQECYEDLEHIPTTSLSKKLGLQLNTKNKEVISAYQLATQLYLYTLILTM